jgi:hypothetical protein
VRTFVDKRKSGPIPYHNGHCVFPCAMIRFIGARGCQGFVKVDKSAVLARFGAQERDIRF